MPAILFVHGTGVRQQSYDDTCATIASQLSRSLPGYELYPCYWGGPEGSRLNGGGASIPDYDEARTVGEVNPQDVAIAEWRLLYEDPDFELDLFLGQPVAGPAAGFSPGAQTPLEGVGTLLNTETPRTRELEEEMRLQDVWAGAKSRLLASLKAAVVTRRRIPDLDGEFCGVLARALVAHASVMAFASPESIRDWPSGKSRDALVIALREAWNQDRGILGGVGGWLRSRLSRVALKIGTSKVARKRGAISDASYPAAGDVLVYQTRGEGIRAFIEKAIRDLPKPLVVLAHSLGGIACVDLLASKNIEGVSHLITAGSQAPLLYELNALWSLPYGKPLPETFPRWLNLYDKHDFLSYIGSGVFQQRVTDVPVDNGQPFPQSHSAYWTNSEVWKAIAGRLA